MKKKTILLILTAACMIFFGGAIYYFLMRGKNSMPDPVTAEQKIGYTKSLIELIGDNLTIIRNECGAYPASLMELVGDAFCSKDCPQVECLRAEDLHDGWGKPFDYFHDEERLTLRSKGKDGQLGGAGEDADMVILLPMKDE